VPGCGKGYDVALLASYGYDAYGLEVSSHAAERANEYLADPGAGPLEGEYKVKDETVGSGKVECLLGDFFENGWVLEVEGSKNVDGEGEFGGFDVVYDNTVSPYHMQLLYTMLLGKCAGRDEMLILGVFGSFSALSHRLCARAGRSAWCRSSQATASSSVSNSRHTSPLCRRAPRGRCRRLCISSC
jgi:hypothetical protein